MLARLESREGRQDQRPISSSGPVRNFILGCGLGPSQPITLCVSSAVSTSSTETWIISSSTTTTWCVASGSRAGYLTSVALVIVFKVSHPDL